MNYVLIFGGGIGTRMQSPNLPKQFIEVCGLPIIVHTIKNFQEHPDIDGIVVVTLRDYIDYMYELIDQYNLSKVKLVVAGGKTGQESIHCGIEALKSLAQPDDIVLIHDAVRPVIDADLITANINSVKEHGNAITVSEATETVLVLDSQDVAHKISKVLERNLCFIGRAPQSFLLKDICALHDRAMADHFESAVDSASLCEHYGVPMFYVRGSHFNIKITTPKDLFLFTKYLEAHKNNTK